jgi:tRNA1(Val) A37 N6-methylase TrmN6
MAEAAEAAPTTVDAFLGGKVEAVQLAGGAHRSGLEAVLLGASLPSSFTGTAIDLGSGVGVAAMCIGVRCAGASVLAVDRDAGAIAAARSALARPANRAFAGHVTPILADIAMPEADRAAAGLGRAIAEAVVMNPPFHAPGAGTHSPHAGRADAHMLGADALEPWFRAAASALRPDGHLVVIFRADAIATLLAAAEGRFGAIAILPLHPRAESRAHRILVRGIKGSRAATTILPGLALHGATGNAYLPGVDAMLRDGAGLGDIHPAWAE